MIGSSRVCGHSDTRGGGSLRDETDLRTRDPAATPVVRNPRTSLIPHSQVRVGVGVGPGQGGSYGDRRKPCPGTHREHGVHVTGPTARHSAPSTRVTRDYLSGDDPRVDFSGLREVSPRPPVQEEVPYIFKTGVLGNGENLYTHFTGTRGDISLFPSPFSLYIGPVGILLEPREFKDGFT